MRADGAELVFGRVNCAAIIRADSDIPTYIDVSEKRAVLELKGYPGLLLLGMTAAGADRLRDAIDRAMDSLAEKCGQP